MDRIETLLKERGLTKAAFADLMGTSSQNVNSLLKNPTKNKLGEIAAALRVPLWQLFASPEDAAMQSLIALIHFGGKSYTPTTVGEVMQVVADYDRQEFLAICKQYTFRYLSEHYAADEKVQSLLNSLCNLLGENTDNSVSCAVTDTSAEAPLCCPVCGAELSLCLSHNNKEK